jgi:hypothetical protein
MSVGTSTQALMRRHPLHDMMEQTEVASMQMQKMGVRQLHESHLGQSTRLGNSV